MTKVTIFDDKDGNHIGIELKGHAGYADAGSDIVCAALSFLVINTENSIELYTGSKCRCEEDQGRGYMKIMLERVGDEGGVQLLMNSMIHGIETLSKQYRKNVKLKFKEV